jgi:lysophospholipase L1-like esterase
MKKRIVCFGDSNTWGYDPTDGSRYDENTRWPMVLQKLRGEDVQVIEEGQNGRTIACEDPWEWGTKKGIDYVIPMIESHMPMDVLIIMLGSNDLKKKFGLPAPDIAGSLQNMLLKIRAHLKYHLNLPDDAVRIIVVAPPHLGEGITTSYFGEFFDGKYAVEQSVKLAHWYKLVADQFGCDFFDAADVAYAGEVDSLHMTPEGHKALGKALAGLI